MFANVASEGPDDKDDIY